MTLASVWRYIDLMSNTQTKTKKKQRGRRLLTRSLTGLALGSVTFTAVSCGVDLGPRPTQRPRTFGEVVYSEVCERVAYTGELAQQQAGTRTSIDASGVAYRPMCNFNAAPPADAPQIMTAVASTRSTIVSDINTIAPEPLLDPIDQTLRQMLPTMDGPAGQKVMVGGGTALLALASDPITVSAIAKLGWREGFRPAGSELLAVRRLIDYSDLYASLSATLPVLWPSTDGAGDAPGAAERTALFAALSREVAAATATANPAAPDRTLNLALRFLLTENAELRTLPAGQSHWGVLRDSRGMPQLEKVAGAFPAPYIDADKDGLADLTPSGYFKDASGSALPYIAPFSLLDWRAKDNAPGRDVDGRVVLKGNLFYRYVNLDDTVLAGLLRDTPSIFDPQKDIPLRLLAGAKLLMGPRVTAHKDYPGDAGLDYSGFDTTQSPILDLAYAFVQLLGFSNNGNADGQEMGRLLRVVSLLLRDQESVMARNMQAMSAAFDEAKKPDYAAAKLAETSTLYDDLAPILVRLLRVNGLLTEVLSAMTNPATADLGQLAGVMMTDADYFYMNQNQLDSTLGNAVIGTTGKLVNRSVPDSDVDQTNSNSQNNRSIMQRVLHLVHDANGHQFCNKNGAKITTPIPLPGVYAPCELLQIDDLAVFYLLSMADPAVKDNIPEADFMNAIRNSLLVNGLTCALLGNLIGIPGFDCTVRSVVPLKIVSYPKPEAAARLLFQQNSLRSAFSQDSMDFGDCEPRRAGTLCCNQNHAWQQHHNGALFALEAVKSTNGRNFYQAFAPIVNAFAKYNECVSYDPSGGCLGGQTRNAAKILVDLLSVMHRHWPSKGSTFYGLPYEAQNKQDNVVSYEPLIAKLLGQGDLWPASLALAPALLGTRVDDGSNISAPTLISEFALWLLDPGKARIGKLTFRDGRDTALRNDGTKTFAPTNDPVIKDALGASVQGKVTPYDLLAEAFLHKRARLATAPDIEASWKGAVSSLADLYLSARSVGGGAYKFQNPRIRSIQLAGLDLLRERVLSHGAAGDLATWVGTGLYGDLSTSLTGPLGAGVLDVADRLSSTPEVHQKLPPLITALVTDPGPGTPDAPRFKAILSMSADLMQMLLNDGDMVPVLKKLGPLFDPDSGAIDGALALSRRGLPTDPDQNLIKIGRNLYTQDATGLYPAFRLGNVINEINRLNAGQDGVFGSVLTEPDYQSILKTVGTFLGDHQRGGARIIDIVQSRNLPPQ